MVYKLREATKRDYEDVHRLQKQVHEIHTEARPDHYRMADITLDRIYYEKLTEDENAKVFILESENEPIAYTILTIKQPKDRPITIPKKVVFIEGFGVDSNWRGKRIGKTLFQEILNFAKEIKADTLELGVWEFNESAIKFYESMKLKTKMRRMEMDI
ncbi:GNAT family N-acetyltransferase [Bacillus sp. HMF5848]|uniref:GNAT family N-acetyltransferase n=1 Tax=Bacillus sp. HMF5848 TaxID=2495421 RepID=UPI000F771B15|nr:GNAT family N-acetyltransferase [Bacillus sp. HMF5848]RSK26577.1 GNAT family N-acetyltransferase [Bacillus sp. HMF5848]